MTLAKRLRADKQFAQTSRPECVRNLELPAMSGCITITSPLARNQLFRFRCGTRPMLAVKVWQVLRRRSINPQRYFSRPVFRGAKGESHLRVWQISADQR